MTHIGHLKRQVSLGECLLVRRARKSCTIDVDHRFHGILHTYRSLQLPVVSFLKDQELLPRGRSWRSMYCTIKHVNNRYVSNHMADGILPRLVVCCVQVFHIIRILVPNGSP